MRAIKDVLNVVAICAIVAYIAFYAESVLHPTMNAETEAKYNASVLRYQSSRYAHITTDPVIFIEEIEGEVTITRPMRLTQR